MDKNVLKRIREYKYPLICAVFQFLLTSGFKTERFFFDSSHIITGNMIFIKVLYSVVSVLSWCFGFHVYKKIKENNPEYARGFQVFCIYFSIIFALILMTWPGTWSWDDIFTIISDKSYVYDNWQHILTSIFHLLYAQLLPFPAGIIILQNVIIALCVSVITVRIERSYSVFLKNKFFDTAIKLIPFLWFPVLRYQLSGYRIGIYSYLEVLFLIVLITAVRDKKELSTGFTVFLGVLCGICSAWRSESFLYIILLTIIVLNVKELGNFSKRAGCIALSFITFLCIGFFQTKYTNEAQYKNNYETAATVSQAAAVIRNTDFNSEKELIEKIDKVIKVDVIRDNPDKSGIYLFWNNGLTREEYTKDDFKNYMISIIKLTAKHPKAFIKERLKTLYLSSGIKGEANVPGTEFILYVFDEEKGTKYTDMFFRTKFVLNRPISKELREKTVLFVNLKNHPQIYKFIWNPVLAICCIITFFTSQIAKKRKTESIITFFLLLKLFIIMLMQPDTYISYYLTFFMTGYLILFHTIIQVSSHNRNRIIGD